MAASEDPRGQWESQADVDACLNKTGVTRDQVNRWRRKGLLPEVEQTWPLAYHGSEVRYPVGTCAQIRAAKELFGTKDRVEFVGWELWWHGYEVDKRHWLRRLRLIARFGDRLLRKIRNESAERDRQHLPSTVLDELADEISSDPRLTKVKRRVGPDNLLSLLGIVLGGIMGGFNANLDSEDRKILDAGFDITQANMDQALGHRLMLGDGLIDFLSIISSLIETRTLSEICNLSEDELKGARNDARTAINLALNFYDAALPVYGEKAFGLREAARQASKSSPNTEALFVLVFAALKRYSSFLLDNETITDLGKKAAAILKDFEELRRLQQVPEFREALSVKNLRRGFRSRDSQWDLLRTIEAAKLNKNGQKLI
jgi:hypothetical protein